MSKGTKQTAAITIWQADKFNSKGEFIQGFKHVEKRIKFGDVDKDEIVKAALEALFKFIKAKKRTKGRAVKGLSLSAPFYIKTEGALTMKLGESAEAYTQTTVKFPSAIYKRDEDEAKLIMYDLFSEMINLMPKDDAKIKDAVEEFNKSVARFN